MTIRSARRLGLLLAVLITTLSVAFAGVSAQDEAVRPEAPPPLQPLDFSPFEAALDELSPERVAELDDIVIEATFDELGAAMEAGDLTAVELTTYYLSRIQAIDVDGLQSMLELNPDALTIAAELDTERAQDGVRGALHGIPVSLKGNIGTGDQMHNTAGAAAIADYRSDRDAFVAAALRDAGAVIIGKANLSEWAYWMNGGPSGFTALGGQVVNPYDPSFDPLGSSSGSAVGTSANTVAASIGTETAGSIIAPASVNGVVGMHPSLGLVSRDRVIPITDQLDTPGTLTRTVADAAALLTAIAGPDPNDPATSAAESVAGTDYTTFLDADALMGKRVGVYIGVADPIEGATDEQVFEALGLAPAVAALRVAGAEVIILWASAPASLIDQVETAGDNGMRIGFADYVASTNPDGPIGSIADVIAFNNEDPEKYAIYGQPLLESAAASDLSLEDYKAAGAAMHTEARDFIDTLMSANDVDVVASLSNAFSIAYAAAGYPAITVPAGRGDTGVPLGLTFSGRHLEDADIIAYAYAFEQAAQLRQAPSVSATE